MSAKLFLVHVGFKECVIKSAWTRTTNAARNTATIFGTGELGRGTSMEGWRVFLFVVFDGEAVLGKMAASRPNGPL